MDKIYIKDLEIYAFHGVYNEEKVMGQKFLISCELFLNLGEAGKNDDLNKTINYAELCHNIEIEFNKNKYNLIEKCAEELSQYILFEYSLVDKVKICIKKPSAPIGKHLDYAAVEIERSWHRAYIGLGSNIGDKESNLLNAITMINNELTKVIKTSKFYLTKPVGFLEQEDFFNGAIEIRTILSPKELMNRLLEIEKELKRERVIKWGPRTIDLDILLYDGEVINYEDVIIPHPRMHQRLFVLEPLCEIAPFAIHPILQKRIYEIIDEISEISSL